MPDTESAYSPLNRLEPVQRERTVSAMRVLRTRARTTNLARVAQLGKALEAAAARRLDETSRAQAVAVAHQLIGSAGTFGYARASDHALELREFFATADHADESIERAREILDTVRMDLDAGPDDGVGEFLGWETGEP